MKKYRFKKQVFGIKPGTEIDGNGVINTQDEDDKWDGTAVVLQFPEAFENFPDWFEEV